MRQVTDAHSQDAKYFFDFGTILLLEDKTNDAVEPYRKAADLEPNNIKYQTMLGEVLKTTGNIDQAITALEAAYNIAEKSIVTNSLRAERRAERRTERIGQQGDEFKVLRDDLASLYTIKRDAAPLDPIWHYRLAILLSYSFSHESESVDEFHKAADLGKNDSRYIEGYIWALFTGGSHFAVPGQPWTKSYTLQPWLYYKSVSPTIAAYLMQKINETPMNARYFAFLGVCKLINDNDRKAAMHAFRISFKVRAD